MRKDVIAPTEKVPDIKIIVIRERNHSEVKLYIPRKLVNGKKVPSVDPDIHWYVYFYLTSLKTGERRKFIYKKGINRSQTALFRALHAFTTFRKNPEAELAHKDSNLDRQNQNL